MPNIVPSYNELSPPPAELIPHGSPDTINPQIGIEWLGEHYKLVEIEDWSEDQKQSYALSMSCLLAESENWQEDDSLKHDMLTDYSLYSDPLLAYEFVKHHTGGHIEAGLIILDTLFRYNTSGVKITRIKPALMEDFLEARKLIEAHVLLYGLDSTEDPYYEQAEQLASSIRKQDNMAQYLTGLESALNFLPTLDRPNHDSLLDYMHAAKAPGLTLEALSLLNKADVLLDLEQDVQNSIYGSAITDKNPMKRAESIIQVIESLKQEGRPMHLLDNAGVMLAIELGEQGQNNPRTAAILEAFLPPILTSTAEMAYLQAVDDYFELKTTDPKATFVPPQWLEIPEFRNKLGILGLPKAIQLNLLAAWDTYNLPIEEYDSPIPPAELDKIRITTSMARRFGSQLEAVIDYAEQYGNKELSKVIDTFGIYNLYRVRQPDLIHEQYLAWEAGEQPAKTIFITARKCWNGALHIQRSPFESGLDEAGFFYFEVNSPADAARVASKVGKRERANGREPAINEVVLNAHGQAARLVIGVNGEDISADELVKAAANRQRLGSRPNDYHRHLGNSFRVIIKSCCTAGQNPNGKNIAESISEGHEALVVAPNSIINGSFEIRKDGTVEFQNSHKNNHVEPVEGIIYDNRRLHKAA